MYVESISSSFVSIQVDFNSYLTFNSNPKDTFDFDSNLTLVFNPNPVFDFGPGPSFNFNSSTIGNQFFSPTWTADDVGAGALHLRTREFTTIFTPPYAARINNGFQFARPSTPIVRVKRFTTAEREESETRPSRYSISCKALVSPLELQVSVGSGDHSFSGDSYGRSTVRNGILAGNFKENGEDYDESRSDRKAKRVDLPAGATGDNAHDQLQCQKGTATLVSRCHILP
ncbi:hypothetical protein EVAR_83062_1 [Eumeta japonica]|uniref:Uncharacterized protein n=1 Tax=Eumeta variegata TaxID=151549 RepID=A0A4C1VQ62_EUMVA|nr:hypothetical protein EVAR_83062_1 [Eumeta japonica]